MDVIFNEDFEEDEKNTEDESVWRSPSWEYCNVENGSNDCLLGFADKIVIRCNINKNNKNNKDNNNKNNNNNNNVHTDN